MNDIRQKERPRAKQCCDWTNVLLDTLTYFGAVASDGIELCTSCRVLGLLPIVSLSFFDKYIYILR